MTKNNANAWFGILNAAKATASNPLPWQTDTCIGNWHYDRQLFEDHGYKSAKTVIHTLADVVSKNGNLLLNIPVHGDGTIDSDEQAIVEEIADWMKLSGESIFGTRPWKVFGEGPAMESAAALTAQGFNEGKGKPFTAEDIRFTAKGNTLYAIALGTPSANKILIKILSAENKLYPQKLGKVTLTGIDQALSVTRTSEGLSVTLPEGIAQRHAYSFKILSA